MIAQVSTSPQVVGGARSAVGDEAVGNALWTLWSECVVGWAGLEMTRKDDRENSIHMGGEGGAVGRDHFKWAKQGPHMFLDSDVIHSPFPQGSPLKTKGGCRAQGSSSMTQLLAQPNSPRTREMRTATILTCLQVLGPFSPRSCCFPLYASISVTGEHGDTGQVVTWKNEKPEFPPAQASRMRAPVGHVGGDPGTSLHISVWQPERWACSVLLWFISCPRWCIGTGSAAFSKRPRRSYQEPGCAVVKCGFPCLTLTWSWSAQRSRVMKCLSDLH